MVTDRQPNELQHDWQAEHPRLRGKLSLFGTRGKPDEAANDDAAPRATQEGAAI
jgi:hypothetical protein